MFKIKIAKASLIREASLSSANILPRQLAGYEAQRRPDGDAYSFPGGFCLSVKLVKPGFIDMCMRCWRDKKVLADPTQIEHLQAVNKVLQAELGSTNSYFVDFSIISEMLRVRNGDVIPGLLMEWVQGDTLNQYVRAGNGKSAAQIKAVAQRFAQMCEYLNNKRISHGDLSSVNIIVKSNGSLKLIDYDSLYTPSMGRCRQYIAGISDYQHPGRKSCQYYETYTDYFSQHIIYTALLMMAEDPSLRPDEELKNMLFSEQDFVSPSAFRQSETVRRGRKMSNQEIRKELDIIERSLAGAISSVPRLQVNSEPESIYRYVNFCTLCGHKFSSDMMKFCTQCGAKRHIYRT